mgnify:CR=1 FL=1
MRRPVRSPPSGSVRCTATRPRAYRTHCHSPLGVPIRYARCRVAVGSTLPLALERTIPYVHRRVAVNSALPGTLDAEWQCGMRRPVRSPPSGSVRCTATRPRAYRTHCHSPLGVPIRYARCRVAVCDALPLALERTIPYVHRRVAVRTRLPPFASCLAPLASIRRSYCRRSRPVRDSWVCVPLRVALSRRRAQGG